MQKHCCLAMGKQIAHRCDKHPDPFDCPDNLIHFAEVDGNYGIIIHDGGSSFVTIEFCPWCGRKLRGDSVSNPIDNEGVGK